ncbi:retrovirus-related Pol polyprotein from transposon 297 [Trichonephila clavipes]|nr:retrovirus-related Pol polyprotein from transposon 297 [Trichonephila clavipes]
MLQEGKVRPIQSPYASPVILTRKNNGLPPDSPEAYRFAIDYRKFNAITKYPRYPLPVINDLISNIPHTGAAPNFQKSIDIILKPVIGRFMMVYMDDVIITSPSFNEHIDHLNQKKEAKFIWSTEAQDAFNKVKLALTEVPVLQLPNFQEQFNLFTDASGVGIGAVLYQNHRPIAFSSRTLNKAERNYTVTERECLAVIWALNKFKTYFGSLPVKILSLFNKCLRKTSEMERVYWGTITPETYDQAMQIYGCDPLHKTVLFGHIENLTFLLERGMSPNTTNFDCLTPLHIACMRNRIDCARILVKYGANKINYSNCKGLPPEVASSLSCLPKYVGGNKEHDQKSL